MKNIRMKPLDAVWLMMESADTPMHVGVLAIFQKPRNASPDYLRRWATKKRESRKPVAPWNYRLSGNSGASISPRLVEEPDFDLDYHFRHSALPAPGGERELGVMVSRLHSNALDRHKPLWEFHLIEGLERNRFAFYVKVHHALVGNVNGIPLLMSMLSESAKRRNMPALWAQPLHADGRGDGDELVGRERRGGLSDFALSARSLRKGASGFLRKALTRDTEGSFLVPAGTPRSTLNRRVNSQRRFATQQFEQARIERLAAATDSTVNEILAYLCGSSLRRFFQGV